MTEDRVDWLVNRIHIACLSLLRLKKLGPYGRDPDFVALLQGFLLHGRQLMDFIRDRESGLRPKDSWPLTEGSEPRMDGGP